MSDLNIDDFRRDAAITLIRLYNNFPRPHSLYIHEVCGEDGTDEFGLISKRYEACLAAMLWLQQEGFLSYKTLLPGEAIEQAVLTLKGIELLLSSSSAGVSRIESFREALSSRSSQKLENAVNEFLNAAK